MNRPLYFHRFKTFGIPERHRAGIEQWVRYGMLPNSFIWAIIVNDLRGACGRASYEDLQNLPAYVDWFVHHAPIECWGSAPRAKDWIARTAELRKRQPGATK